MTRINIKYKKSHHKIPVTINDWVEQILQDALAAKRAHDEFLLRVGEDW